MLCGPVTGSGEARTMTMPGQNLPAAVVLVLASIQAGGALAQEVKYPDLRGVWERPGAAQWDPTKPGGLRQQAPLTAQFQKVFEANMAETRAGGQDYNPQVKCLPSGMP